MDKFEVLLSKLAKPAQRAIHNAGLKSLEDISSIGEKEFADLHGIGKNAIRIVQEFLFENGLNFKK